MINASPQRFAYWNAIQVECGHEPLNLIQDVKTRWNSSFYMLVRAYRLRRFIATFAANPDYKSMHCENLLLQSSEWQQVLYVIEVLGPFRQLTELVSRGVGTSVSIHHGFWIYNRLLDHLDSYGDKLKACRAAWKVSIENALLDAQQKLRQYYDCTWDEAGRIYNLATILNPAVKLTIYRNPKLFTPDFEDIYREEFEHYYNTNYAKYSSDRVIDTSIGTSVRPESNPSNLDSILYGTSQETSRLFDSTSSEPELTRYLDSGVVKNLPSTELLSWWKQHEEDYPGLSKMARDILAIPIASVGSEREFSRARDVNTYRRNQMLGSTLESIMLIKHYDQNFHSDAEGVGVDIDDKSGCFSIITEIPNDLKAIDDILKDIDVDVDEDIESDSDSISDSGVLPDMLVDDDVDTDLLSPQPTLRSRFDSVARSTPSFNSPRYNSPCPARSTRAQKRKQLED